MIMLKQHVKRINSALKVLGDAKNIESKFTKKVKLSKKLRKLVNKSNINNISTVRKAYNNMSSLECP